MDLYSGIKLQHRALELLGKVESEVSDGKIV